MPRGQRTPATKAEARVRLLAAEAYAGAADLARATADGQTLGAVFARLIDLKDQAHYGVVTVPAQRSRAVLRWARQLTDRAREEVER